jgi:hypothetical protein
MSDDLSSIASSAATAGALGALGRVLHFVRNDRRPVGWSLVWEVPAAIGMGIVGKGVAQFFGFTGFVEYSTIIVVAYIGPRFIDQLVTHVENLQARRAQQNRAVVGNHGDTPKGGT